MAARRFGDRLSAGFEYAAWQNVTLGLEYRHTFYGNRGLNLGTTPVTMSVGSVTPGAAIAGVTGSTPT
jgi:opacity protein-like surface antigen